MVVNSEIRFQKRSKCGPSEPSTYPYIPGEEPGGALQVKMLFGVELTHASDFEV